MSIHTTDKTLVVYLENGHYTALSFYALHRSFPVCHVNHYENMSLGLTTWCLLSHLCRYLIEVTWHYFVITRNPHPTPWTVQWNVSSYAKCTWTSSGPSTNTSNSNKAAERKVTKRSDAVRLNSRVGQKLYWDKTWTRMRFIKKKICDNRYTLTCLKPS